MSNDDAPRGGVNIQLGFGGLLFIVFLVLRLTDQIDWAWYWVAAPLWIPVVLIVMIAIGIGLGSAFTGGRR